MGKRYTQARYSAPKRPVIIVGQIGTRPGATGSLYTAEGVPTAATWEIFFLLADASSACSCRSSLGEAVDPTSADGPTCIAAERRPLACTKDNRDRGQSE